MTAAAAAGDDVLELDERRRSSRWASSSASAWAREEFEIREITAIDAAARTVTLDRALSRDHAAGRVGRHGVRAGALVPRRRPRQRVLARPRGRHPRLGQGPRRPAHRGAQGLDLPRPEDGRGGRLRHHRRHPHARTRWRPAWSTAPSASWRCGRSATTRSPTRRSTCAPSRGPSASPRTATRRCCSPPGATATRARRCPRAYRNDPFVIRTVNVTGNGIDSLHLDRAPLLHGVQAPRRARQGDAARRRTPSSTACRASSPPSSRAARAARRATPATTCT